MCWWSGQNTTLRCAREPLMNLVPDPCHNFNFKASRQLATFITCEGSCHDRKHTVRDCALPSVPIWRSPDNKSLFGTMADTFIKPDPETKGASPGALADDDGYEDVGDLEFNPDPAWQGLYLARVPKSIWEAWSKLDEDAEIQLGTIRIENIINPDGSPGVWQPYYLPSRQTSC